MGNKYERLVCLTNWWSKTKISNGIEFCGKYVITSIPWWRVGNIFELDVKRVKGKFDQLIYWRSKVCMW